MIKNYITIALRSLMASKLHSSINVFGLGLGIAVCFLITLYVHDEWTFDTFHTKANRIYRVWGSEDWGEKQQFFNTVTPFPMGPTLKSNFPEVENQVRFNNIGAAVKVGKDQYTETVSIGGQDFFEVFDFVPIRGSLSGALSGQNNIVLTRSTALKYFGNEDPVGKLISIQLAEAFEEFVVRAVVEEIPTNSSLQFSLLMSDLNYTRLYNPGTLTSGWFNINPETYVLLQDQVDPRQLEKKFPPVFRTALGEENFAKSHYKVGLQPLTSIHLDNSFPTGIAPVSDQKYSYILVAIAALILLVACINFVTLSIGRSIQRAKEVGIRKVVGAKRQQLIAQFIGEALMVTLVAIVIGMFFSWFGLNTFNELSGKNLAVRPDVFSILTLLCLIAVIGLLAGSYPAFVLSNFKPIAILKGKISGSSKQGLRKALVGIQIVLSIFLISSTLVMRQQLSFLQNKDLGFNREQLVVIPLPVSRAGRMAERVKAGFEQAEQFKTELSKVPAVLASCGSSHDFGNGGWTNIGYTDDLGNYRTFSMNVVDDDYLPTLKMEVANGRNFSDSITSDYRRAVIVNEAFVKEYGWKDPIGMRIPGKAFNDHEIIGVVKDFNYASLYSRVAPLVLVMNASIPLSGSENINIDNSPFPKLIMRLAPGNLSASMDEVKGVWDRLTNGSEFDFAFVDQSLAAQYRNDQHLGKIVTVTTVLAMIIGSLGLYALASLAMQHRTKEVSIRKVMGASEQSLLMLLSKDYFYLIGISLILSVPLTWYLMDRWLQSFEYRVGVGWGVFAIAGLISMVIAGLTISYQTIKTTWTRPAETLKYE